MRAADYGSLSIIAAVRCVRSEGRNANPIIKEGTMQAHLRYVVMCGGIIAVLSVLGCADKPKAMPQPTSPQVKSDSDRFFDKMKQDEREHGNAMAPAH